MLMLLKTYREKIWFAWRLDESRKSSDHASVTGGSQTLERFVRAMHADNLLQRLSCSYLYKQFPDQKDCTCLGVLYYP